MLLLLPLFAQRSSSSAAGSAAVGAFFLVYFLFIIAVYLFYGFCLMKIFQKAGIEGWWGFVPILNTFGLIKVAGREPWWIILFFIPCVSIIAAIVVYMDVAKSFGKDAIWGLGLIFLGFIFLPILAFGSAQYIGPAYSAAGAYGGAYQVPPQAYPGYQQQYPQQGYPQQQYPQPQPQYPQQGYPQQPTYDPNQYPQQPTYDPNQYPQQPQQPTYDPNQYPQQPQQPYPGQGEQPPQG